MHGAELPSVHVDRSEAILVEHGPAAQINAHKYFHLVFKEDRFASGNISEVNKTLAVHYCSRPRGSKLARKKRAGVLVRVPNITYPDDKPGHVSNPYGMAFV